MMTSDDSESSQALWQRITQESQPLALTRRVLDAPESPKICKERMRQRQFASTHAADAFSQWMLSLPAVSGAVPEGASMQGVGSCRFDARLKKRLGRGAERIDAVLDLHGLTLAQAHGQLHHFLGLAVQRGQRTVLVITGKGREGEGVLRRSVPVWLDAESSLGIVQGYDSAANHHGGSGAFYVRLRRVVHGNDGGRG